jgi:hypothetical protein
VKYLLLLYGDPEGEAALSPEERRAIVDAHLAFQRKLRDDGVLVRGEPLGGSSGAFTLRLQADGNRLVTDGPYVATKEHLGSYYIIECTAREEAEAAAREVPASPGLAIEAWPISEL